MTENQRQSKRSKKFQLTISLMHFIHAAILEVCNTAAPYLKLHTRFNCVGCIYDSMVLWDHRSDIHPSTGTMLRRYLAIVRHNPPFSPPDSRVHSNFPMPRSSTNSSGKHATEALVCLSCLLVCLSCFHYILSFNSN